MDRRQDIDCLWETRESACDTGASQLLGTCLRRSKLAPNLVLLQGSDGAVLSAVSITKLRPKRELERELVMESFMVV